MRTQKQILRDMKRLMEKNGEWPENPHSKEMKKLLEEHARFMAVNDARFDKLASRLVDCIRKDAITVGIVCGPQWKRVGKSLFGIDNVTVIQIPNIPDYYKRQDEFRNSRFHITSAFSVNRHGLPNPKFEDYPAISIEMAYDSIFTVPTIDSAKLLKILRNGKVRVYPEVSCHDPKDESTIKHLEANLSLLGKFEGQFLHLNISLKNNWQKVLEAQPTIQENLTENISDETRDILEKDLIVRLRSRSSRKDTPIQGSEHAKSRKVNAA